MFDVTIIHVLFSSFAGDPQLPSGSAAHLSGPIDSRLRKRAARANNSAISRMFLQIGKYVRLLFYLVYRTPWICPGRCLDNGRSIVVGL